MKLHVKLKLFCRSIAVLLVIFTVVLLFRHSPLFHPEANIFVKTREGNIPIYIHLPQSVEKNVTTNTSHSTTNYVNTKEETTENIPVHTLLQPVTNNNSNINTINPVANISSIYPSKFENLWIEIDKKQRLVSNITDLYISAVNAIPY